MHDAKVFIELYQNEGTYWAFLTHPRQSPHTEPSQEDVTLFEDMIQDLSFSGNREFWFPKDAVRWAKLPRTFTPDQFQAYMRTNATAMNINPYQQAEVTLWQSETVWRATRIIHQPPRQRWVEAIKAAILAGSTPVGSGLYLSDVKDAPFIALNYSHSLGGVATFTAGMYRVILSPRDQNVTLPAGWFAVTYGKKQKQTGFKLSSEVSIGVRIGSKDPDWIVDIAVSKARDILQKQAEEAVAFTNEVAGKTT